MKIHEYLSEIESVNIERLANSFKNKEVKKPSPDKLNRVIIRYEINGDKAIPIYQD